MLYPKMKQKLKALLRDDIGKGDVTSAVLKPEKCTATIFAKEACVAAGLEEAKFLFSQVGVRAELKARDGQALGKGKTVIVLWGINKKILQAERTALNILGRMSEVATTCAAAKKIVAGKVTIALTRKTMPGFNLFDKKAAAIVGIWPHRINLNSFVLLKENHLSFFSSPSAAVAAARKKYGKRMRIEVETENRKQALDAAKAKPDIIMLDNVKKKEAKKAVKGLRAVFRGKIELSGGINMENLKVYARAKPDIISMGSLTYSTKWRDFSLRIEK